MARVYLIAVLAVLAGCAAKQPEPTAAVAVPVDTLQAAVTELDVADFTSSTICKTVTFTGSRMSRGELCTSKNVDPRVAEYERQRREWEINEIHRRSSVEIERQRREALRAQFPMGRF